MISRPLRSGAVLAAVALAALGLTSCGSRYSPHPPSGHTGLEQGAETKRTDPVFARLGAASQLASTQDGSLMLAYRTDWDSEGPTYYGWRLYGPDGRKVAEDGGKHSGIYSEDHDPEEVVRAAQGFFLRVERGADFFIGTGGEVRPVTERIEPRVPKPGDSLVQESPPMVYRPSTASAAPLGGLSGAVQASSTDRGGTAWIAVSPSGDERGRIVPFAHRGERSYELPAGMECTALATNGGTTVAVLRPDDSDTAGSRAPSLLVTDDNGKTWGTVRSSKRLPLESMPDAPELVALHDGRTLIGGSGDVEEGGRYWLADDSGNRSFRAVKTPADFTLVDGQGGTLYALEDDPSSGEGVWTSRNGRDWAPFPDGGDG